MIKWTTFTELAEHKGAQAGTSRFNGMLPVASACDFDDLKGVFCANRASFLSSVDALTTGFDGRFYFIEFKDIDNKYPLGDLRRKAFDSLVIFWMSLGSHFSFYDICCRSVFVYVVPDAESVDADCDSQSVLFIDELPEGASPKDMMGLPIELQLAELKAKGLFADVWTIPASEFTRRHASLVGTIDEPEFRLRLGAAQSKQPVVGRSPVLQSQTASESLNRILLRERAAAGRVEGGFCDDAIEAVDFRDMTRTLDELRCPLSSEGRAGAKGLYKCDAFRAVDTSLYLYYDWDVQRPKFSTLVNKVFDGYLQWMLICHAQDPKASVSSALRLFCVCEGTVPPPPSEEKIPIWQKAFWKDYRPAVVGIAHDADGDVLGYGLRRYMDAGFYSNIKTMPLVGFDSFIKMK